MDAFYASVEQRDNPALKGKPVVVAGAPPRGVVAAASYESRRFGIKSAMSTAKAIARCPELIIVSPRIDHYANVSETLKQIFREYTPLVEPLSLDEAFLDLAGTDKLLGSAASVGHRIKRQVRRSLGLTVSVGIAKNKFVAKIASDLSKPDGLIVVSPDETESFLYPLPIERLFGVGKVTAASLHDLGVTTIGDLAKLPVDILTRKFGRLGPQLANLSRGIDDRVVVSDRRPKSIGQEDTFEQDLTDLAKLRTIVIRQAERVAQRLRKNHYKADTVVLKVKTTSFKRYTRQVRLHPAASDNDSICKAALTLLEQIAPGIGPLRLTGVTAAGLRDSEGAAQLSFDQKAPSTQDALAAALDDIQDKFGKNSVVRADQLVHDE